MLKTCAKKIIYALAARGGTSLLRLIDGAQTISFDVFDTLVKRDVIDPADVFAILERQFTLSGELTLANFACLRIQAEQKAHAAHPEREITLEEIYACLPLSEAERVAAMQAECRMEWELSAPNLALKLVYEECVRQGKAIYFISDMYLPMECIEAILRKNGYTKGKLYVSSQNGLTKHSGELYAFVERTEHLDRKTWLHIGDSISSDWLIPKKLGMKSALVRRDLCNSPYVDRKTAKTNEAYRRLNHFISNRIDRYTDPYERIGYVVLGPLLYGFARWLDETVPLEDTMVFLARDGAILQRAFQIVSQRSSVYFYISRGAVRGPYAAHLKSLDDYPNQSGRGLRTFSPMEVARWHGLNEKEAQSIFERQGIEGNKDIEDPITQNAVLRAIWPKVVEKGRQQYVLLQQYICDIGLSNRCAIIDIGWEGTIQFLLSKCGFTVENRPIRWSGYYMGSFEENPLYAKDAPSKARFLFSEGVNRNIFDSVKYSRFFFEMLFQANHGTTKGYERSAQGKIKPILGEPDHTEKQIDDLQTAALRFVSDLAESPVNMALSLDAAAAAGNYLDLARVPKMRTLKLFENFEYEDGHVFKLVSAHGACYYFLHPREFMDALKNCPCKSWFMKSVFKLPLPYIKILNLLRNVALKE